MSGSQRQPNGEQAPPSRSSGRSSQKRDDPVSAEDLLRLHSEVMLRIGRLEAQVEHLSQRLDERPGNLATSAGGGAGDPEPSLSHDAPAPGRGDAAPAPLAPPALGTADPGRQTWGDYEAEMGQMRLRIVTLSEELARAEDKLKLHGGETARRRRRSHSGRRRRWWRFWGRRKGGQ